MEFALGLSSLFHCPNSVSVAAVLREPERL